MNLGQLIVDRYHFFGDIFGPGDRPDTLGKGGTDLSVEGDDEAPAARELVKQVRINFKGALLLLTSLRERLLEHFAYFLLMLRPYL